MEQVNYIGPVVQDNKKTGLLPHGPAYNILAVFYVSYQVFKD